jgi:hypothetical protein
MSWIALLVFLSIADQIQFIQTLNLPPTPPALGRRRMTSLVWLKGSSDTEANVKILEDKNSQGLLKDAMNVMLKT